MVVIMVLEEPGFPSLEEGMAKCGGRTHGSKVHTAIGMDLKDIVSA